MRVAASLTATALAALVLAVPGTALAQSGTGGAGFDGTPPAPVPTTPATPATTGGATTSVPPATGLPPATTTPGSVATVGADGMATAPADAPPAVAAIIAAGNEIARKPYVWGGGHQRWTARGYDCSGSVSFALHGANLLDGPLVSGSFAHWGDAGPGSWVTIYANGGHVFMIVAGLRFDTSGQRQAGTRWQPAPRRVRGFAVRHPVGL